MLRPHRDALSSSMRPSAGVQRRVRTSVGAVFGGSGNISWALVSVAVRARRHRDHVQFLCLKAQSLSTGAQRRVYSHIGRWSRYIVGEHPPCPKLHNEMQVLQVLQVLLAQALCFFPLPFRGAAKKSNEREAKVVLARSVAKKASRTAS